MCIIPYTIARYHYQQCGSQTNTVPYPTGTRWHSLACIHALRHNLPLGVYIPLRAASKGALPWLHGNGSIRDFLVVEFWHINNLYRLTGSPGVSVTWHLEVPLQ